MWTVMAADDEIYIREALPTIVDWASYGCTLEKIVSDGQQLLDEMTVSHPDLILTDIRMPAVDGLAICKYVHDTCPETQVILLTAYSDFDYAKQALRYGACEYILKIDMAQELAAAVEKAVGRLEKQKKELLDDTLQPAQTPPTDIFSGICRYIDDHYARNFSLAEMAEALHASPSYLSRLYKAKTGENLFDCVMQRRIECARQYLRSTDMKIYEVGQALGFEDAGYFSRIFKKTTGMAPKEYRNETT